MEYFKSTKFQCSPSISLFTTGARRRSPFTALRRRPLGHETDTILTSSGPGRTYITLEEIRIDNFSLQMTDMVSLHKRIMASEVSHSKLITNSLQLVSAAIYGCMAGLRKFGKSMRTFLLPKLFLFAKLLLTEQFLLISYFHLIPTQ